MKNYEYNACVASSAVKTSYMAFLSKKFPVQYDPKIYAQTTGNF
jgi:hypothetical protein